MNWMVRNLTVLLFSAATSAIVAAVLVYMEAANGNSLFSYTMFRIIPVGAIAAGFAGAIGLLLGSLALRLRPAGMTVFAILAIAAGVVFMAESVEFALFLNGPAQATASVGSYSRFLGNSLIHSQLRYWSSDASPGDSSMSAFLSPGTSPAAPHVEGLDDNKAGGIASGVQGMMATQDVSQTATGRRLNQMGTGIQTLGAGVQAHGTQWVLTITQTLGFAIGGLVVFIQLRERPHCKGCRLLLSTKGERTRYYSRTKEMQAAVDDVLTKARDRRLQESISAHLGRGHDKRANWVQFASTIELRRCTQCNMHTLDYRSSRREGQNWKSIDLLAFSTTSTDPLNFA